MGAKMKATVYSKFNDSPVGCWMSSKNKISQVLRVRLYWLKPNGYIICAELVIDS